MKAQEQIAADLDRMIELRKDWLKGCERMIQLLQPEWNLFEARDGSHNLYASREYAEHTSQARKHRNEIETLEGVRAILKEQDDG